MSQSNSFRLGKFVTATLLSALVIVTFQNCRGQNFGSSPAGSESLQNAQTEGDVSIVQGTASEIATKNGQKLRFTNIRNQPVGNLSIEERTASDVVVNIYNPLTGRGGKVRIKINATTGAFSTIERADRHPYLCKDQSQSVCALVDGAPNCSSPIYFHDQLSGSIENLREPAESQYCGTYFSPEDRASWLRLYHDSNWRQRNH